MGCLRFYRWKAGQLLEIADYAWVDDIIHKTMKFCRCQNLLERERERRWMGGEAEKEEGGGGRARERRKGMGGKREKEEGDGGREGEGRQKQHQKMRHLRQSQKGRYRCWDCLSENKKATSLSPAPYHVICGYQIIRRVPLFGCLDFPGILGVEISHALLRLFTQHLGILGQIFSVLSGDPKIKKKTE